MLYLLLSHYWYRTSIQTYSATSPLNPHCEMNKFYAKLLLKWNKLCGSGSGRISALPLPLPQEKDRFHLLRFHISGRNIRFFQAWDVLSFSKSDIAKYEEPESVVDSYYNVFDKQWLLILQSIRIFRNQTFVALKI